MGHVMTDFRTDNEYVIRIFAPAGGHTASGEFANVAVEVYRIFEGNALGRGVYHIKSEGSIGLRVENPVSLANMVEEINAGIEQLKSKV